MKLFYTEPKFLGISSIFSYGVGLLGIVLLFSTNNLLLRAIVILTAYFSLVFGYYKVFLYQDKIMVKRSVLKFWDKVREVNYDQCVSFQNGNSPYVSNNFIIKYKVKREIKIIGIHILDKKKVEEIIDFLKSKNKRIKIEVDIPNV